MHCCNGCELFSAIINLFPNSQRIMQEKRGQSSTNQRFQFSKRQSEGQSSCSSFSHSAPAGISFECCTFLTGIMCGISKQSWSGLLGIGFTLHSVHSVERAMSQCKRVLTSSSEQMSYWHFYLTSLLAAQFLIGLSSRFHVHRESGKLIIFINMIFAALHLAALLFGAICAFCNFNFHI